MGFIGKLLGRKPKPLLAVVVDAVEVLAMEEKDGPNEAAVSFSIHPESVIEFHEESGRTHSHTISGEVGSLRLTVRVYPTYGVQAIGQLGSKEVRFQPFYIKKKGHKLPDLKGKGLATRGFHDLLTRTPSNVVLSALCDECEKSFQFTSFHASSSGVTYFYSSSGKYTLTVNEQELGEPGVKPSEEAVQALERKLPSAPDASKYSYLNPFRCPHCSAPYIDFEKYPEIRVSEFYGNLQAGQKLQSF